MALSQRAIDALTSMGEEIDLAWQANTRRTRGTDEELNISIGDAIARCAALDEVDWRELLSANEDFWETVVVAYSYRSEVIERAHRFAPYPDPTCGSSWQGYPDRKFWDCDDIPFEKLAVPFIEKGKSEYGRVEGKIESKTFPPLANQMEPPPWQATNTERYLKKMAQLGYAL